MFVPEHEPPATHPISAQFASLVRFAVGSSYTVTNRGRRLDIEPPTGHHPHAMLTAALQAATGRVVELNLHRR